jgi:Zn-dependent metalloprotease
MSDLPDPSRQPGRTCTILPPYLLDRLRQAPELPAASAATRTLEVDGRVRAHRELRAARRGGERPGPPSPGGFVPEPLLQKAQPPTGTAPAVVAPAPLRSIHDSAHGTTLPGALVRPEGAAPNGDPAVGDAYDHLGATWQLYWRAYRRNSLDGRGLELVASVHYSVDYDNAFWDGTQMVFGDGDGPYFNSFTESVDVVGHELTHGVTQFTAGLTYVGQSGALNESVSDVFGSLVKQMHLGQRAEEADWLIGDRLFTSKVHGVALRSMKAPGTAYDDPVLGKDPQPADMDGFVDLPHDDQHDSGGVHTNSGIPNHAFYLAATALGGNAWEQAGQVWYDALTAPGLAKDIGFAGFAGATVNAATTRFGADSPAARAVREAWLAVKVLS